MDLVRKLESGRVVVSVFCASASSFGKMFVCGNEKIWREPDSAEVDIVWKRDHKLVWLF